jgi:NADH dehydrogenase
MRRIVVIGAGFAGMWSALAAARLIDLRAASGVEVVVVAPEPVLHVRPRLYEDSPGSMAAPLLPLFRETGIRFIRGIVDGVDTTEMAVSIVAKTGEHSRLTYDRLILASGSQLYRPSIPGLKEFAFSVDQLDEASELDLTCRAWRSVRTRLHGIPWSSSAEVSPGSNWLLNCQPG